MTAALKEAVNAVAAYTEEPVARLLAEQPADLWTQKQKVYLYQLLSRYDGILRSLGIDYDSIDDPACIPQLPESPYSIKLEKNRFVVKFPGRDDPPCQLTKDIRAIPRSVRDRSNDTYVVPARMLSTEGLHAFLSSKPRRLSMFEVEPAAAELMAWILSEAKRRYEASRAADAEIDMDGFGLDLYNYQKAGIVAALAFKRGFIADDMGLGKTRQGLGVLWKAQAYPGVFTVPPSVVINWYKEAAQGLTGKRIWMAKNKKAPKHTCKTARQTDLFYISFDESCDACTFEHSDAIILNYDKWWHGWVDDDGKRVNGDERDGTEKIKLSELGEAILALNPNFMAQDESHYAKSGGALRTKALLKFAEICKPTYRLNLSGTPILNRPIEIMPQLEIIDRLADLGGSTYFTQRYCGFGGAKRKRGETSADGSSNEKELNDKLRYVGYVRREKTDERIGLELPELTDAILYVDITNRAEYTQAEEDIITWCGEQAVRKLELTQELKDLPRIDAESRKARARAHAEMRAMRAEAVIRLNALQMITARGKLAAIEDWIADHKATGKKLCVFAYHIEIQEHFTQKYECLHIVGADSQQERQNAKEMFQGEMPAPHGVDSDLILCSFRAAKEGITLTAASELLTTQFGSWTPADYDQIAGRLHRIGQKWPVTNYYALGIQTIDETIYARVQHKRKITSAVISGDEKKDIVFELIDDFAALARRRTA